MACDRCPAPAAVKLERGHFACDERCGCRLRAGHRAWTYLCSTCWQLLRTTT